MEPLCILVVMGESLAFRIFGEQMVGTKHNQSYSSNLFAFLLENSQNAIDHVCLSNP